MPDSDGYHVLTRSGDASDEVARLVRELGDGSEIGLHRCFFVSRARQTVVMATGPDAPIARALRARPGWLEPGAGDAPQS
jgi:hypothetical protein